MIPDPQDQPTLSVDEVALVYGVGRSAAYEQCRQWLTTDGATGIPALRFGRTIRCPTAAVRVQLGIDPQPPRTEGMRRGT